MSQTIASESGDVHRLGKLNLVDLAGSEDIKRSGADARQAAEAGMINRSLLSLGKCISHLSKNSQSSSGGAPSYRDCKLTRILQDSLGGGTRTCIIATISMADTDSQETRSTLNYADHAKSITTKIKTIIPKTPFMLYEEYRKEALRLQNDLEVCPPSFTNAAADPSPRRSQALCRRVREAEADRDEPDCQAGKVRGTIPRPGQRQCHPQRHHQEEGR